MLCVFSANLKFRIRFPTLGSPSQILIQNYKLIYTCDRVYAFTKAVGPAPWSSFGKFSVKKYKIIQYWIHTMDLKDIFKVIIIVTGNAGHDRY